MPVRRTQEVSSDMRAALALSEPDLDTTVGTPVRKIIDAVAEVVAEAYVESHLLDYQYDIDAKTGADLDDFVRLFGFSRFPAKRAVGTVVFERNTAAGQAVLIPINSQLSTDGTAPIIVQTTTPALINEGETSVQVPVQAVIGGAQGNISANSLRRRLTSLEGINSFTNIVALTGGADAETDEQLRDRFKRTIFRSMAGTEPMFVGIALDDEAVTQVNVIGATKRRRETLELLDDSLGDLDDSLGDLIEGSPWAISTVQDAAYIYPDSQVFGSDIDNGSILTPGVHYEFVPSIPPIVYAIDDQAVTPGVYDLIYEYVPLASRNDVENGITNRVDIYVNGTRLTEASETTVFKTSKVFNATPGDPLNVANFERDTGEPPVAGNFFVQYSMGPVTDASTEETITIGASEYTLGVDAFVVNDITRQGGTPNSLSGVELVSNGNGGPADPSDATLFQVGYIFNAVPRDIEIAARAWRLITTDVRVHQAKAVRLNLHIAIILEQGYPLESVQPVLEEDLARFIGTIGFNGVVQISDLMEVATQVPGVDAVRFLNSSDDDTDFAIQRVSPTGSVLETFEEEGRAIDVIFSDDEYPVFNDLTISVRAQNSFGKV